MFSEDKNAEEKPHQLTYTYTTQRQKSQNQKSTYSVTTSLHTSQQSISNSSSHRINQILPKPKIVIPRSLQQSSIKSSSVHPFSRPTDRHKNQQSSQVSIKYESLSPTFNWNKFKYLCGGEFRLGQNGCLCSEPCKWKQTWIKYGLKKDLAVFQTLLKHNAATKENINQIEKDLPRTHPDCPTFSANRTFRSMLKQILTAYSVYDIQIGYIQGLNMIAGVLLYHIKNAQQTFWALVEMMEYTQLRMIYLDNFIHLHDHCVKINQILRSKMPDLYDHMMDLQICSEVFLNGWVLSLLSNCIPMEYMHLVIDKFRSQGWGFIYRLIATYLLFLQEVLLMAEDQAQFLSNFSVKNSRDLGVSWPEMILASEKFL